MNIIPMPVVVSSSGGSIPLGKKTVITGDFDKTITKAKKLLSKTDSKESKLIFSLDKAIAAEGYSINCSGDEIKVTASTEKGAYYALMTIEQLRMNGNTIESVKIQDSPKYSYRGFMLDVARHFWSIDKIKEIIDNMSKLKFNYFHWHLSEDQGWRVEIKKYPELTKHGAVRKSTPLALKGYNWKDPSSSTVERENMPYGEGLFYTQDQCREIVAYAKERHIEVYPEIDMPGHLVSAISCYPYLSCKGDQLDVSTNWGVMDDIGCCGKEDIYNFTKDIIDELVDVFDCEYFHIGGDEVPKKKWEKCPNCQAKIKELGLKNENDLQGHFNNVICQYLSTKGKKMVGWNEVLDAPALSTDVVVQWWTNHGTPKVKELAFMSRGGRVIMSMCPYVYMDHPFAVRPLKKSYSMTAKALGIKDKTKVFGVEAPQWTEYIRNEDKLDLNTYARLITMSEVAWTADNIMNYKSFESRLEALRGYFSLSKMRIAPQYIYRGKSIKGLGRYAKGWAKWRETPDFELAIVKGTGEF